jgi:2-methylcitrate dehydratase PrpD
MRRRIVLTEDPSRASDSAAVRLVLRDGRNVETEIGHCRGSQARPMSDGDLDEKFRGQAAVNYPAGRIEALRAACWDIAEEKAVGDFVRRWFG